MKRFFIILVSGLFLLGSKVLWVGANTSSWTTGELYADIKVSRIMLLAEAEAYPDIIYAVEYYVEGNYGLFKTVDCGNTWTKISFPGEDVKSVMDVAVFSNNPDIVYMVIRGNGNLTERKGYIYKSVDGGNTWEQKEWVVAKWVNTITIDPVNPDIIYAGVGESLHLESYGGEIVGIYKSTDGGETWLEKVAEELDIDAVVSLLIDSNDPLCIYAGAYTWNEHGYGFLKSTDGGETWISKDISSITGDEVTALAVSSAGFDPPVIYAVSGSSGDVYTSTDKGESWTETNYEGSGAKVLAVDPNDPDVIYAGTSLHRAIWPEVGDWSSELYKSTDGGNTWMKKDEGLPEFYGYASIIIDPRNSDVYLNIYAGDVYKSTDGAESWQNLSQASIKGLAVHPTFSNIALAAVHGRGLAKTTDGGSTWNHLSYNIGAVIFDPQNPSTIWVGGDTSTYKSTDDGQNWIDSTFLDCSPGSCQSTGSDILIKPDDPDCILVATSGIDGVLARTTDGGSIWEQIGSSNVAITIDPINPDFIYLVKTSGQVFQYSNVWESWSSLDITPIEEIGEVRDVEIDSHSNLYVAANRLWKWDGSDWTELISLPADSTTAVAVDKSISPGIVYVGTEKEGVFVSQDEGNTWEAFNDDLVTLSIYKLTLSRSEPKILYAGTAIGTIWSSPAIEGTVTYVEQDLPNNYCLSQNYPNPFNPTTSITYSIAKPGYVILEIYNISGQKVTTLFKGNRNTGTYSVTWDVSNQANGMYFSVMKSGGITKTVKMMVVK